jgi:tape measure domain-containing protein
VAKGDLTFNLGVEVDTSDLNRGLSNLGTLTREELKRINELLGGRVEKTLVIKAVTQGDGTKKQVAEYQEILTAVDSIVNKQKQLDRVQQGSVTSLRQQVNQAKQARDEIAKYETSVGLFGGSLKTISASWAAQNEKVQQLQRSLDVAEASGFWRVAKTSLNLNGLSNFAAGLTQITNGLQAVSIIVGQVTSSINGLVNALGDIQSFKLSFEAIGQGAGGASVALTESSRIALGLGVDLKTVREGFQKLSPVITNSGGTISDVSNVVEALSSRFAAFGISGEKAKRVTNGIIQAFAKGKLMAEELTQQISEADPAFKTDFAKSVGVSVAQLEALVKAGKITNEVLIQKLPGVSKSGLLFGRLGNSASDAADSLEKSGTTVDQVRANINTINQLSLERFAKSVEPLLFAFVKLGAVVADSLDRLSKLSAVASLGSAFGSLGQSLVKIADFLLRFGEAGVSALSVFAKIAEIILKFPGISEAFAVAIVAKLIGPLASLKGAFGQIIDSSSLLGKSLRTVTTFSGLREAITSLGSSGENTKEKISRLSKEHEMLGRRAQRTQSNIATLQNRIAGYKKISGNLTALPDFSVNESAQKQVEAYRQKIERTQSTLSRLSDGYDNIVSRQAAVSASLTELSARKGLAARAATVLGRTIQGVGNAGKSLIRTIGPLGVLLGVIAIGTSAYETANKSSNAIMEQSKQRVESLKAALKDLGGSTTQLEAPVTGLALVWKKFSYVFSDVVKSLGRPFEGISEGAQKAAPGIASFVDLLGRITQAALVGAVGGAILGATFFGIAAAPSAAVGALLAVIVSLAAGTDDAAVKTRELADNLKQVEAGARLELAAIDGVINKLNELSATKNEDNTLKIAAGYSQVQAALVAVKKNIEEVKGQQAGLSAEAQKYAPAAEKARSVYAKIQENVARIKELESQIRSAGGTANAPKEWNRQLVLARVNALKLRAQFENIKNASPDSTKYFELQNRLEEVGNTLRNLEGEYAKVTEKADAFAAANGFLTSKQKETIPTVATVTEKIKELTTSLQTDLNPKATPEKWQEITRLIAQQNVELENLNDSIAISTGKEYVIRIRTQIEAGSINNSIENTKRIISSLEQQAVLLDINSPELPNVLRDLVSTQSYMNQLNGKRATMTVALMEQAGAGSISATVSQIDLYIQALNEKKASIPIGASNIDEVIQQINYVTQLRDAGARSSADLERQLNQAVFDDKIRQIREEQAARNEVFDGQIAQLRELGPAERELAAVREADLQRRAATGDLEANAQLERLYREKEILNIRKEQDAFNKRSAADMSDIEKQQEADRKAQRDKELVAVREVLEARRAGTALVQEAVQPSANISVNFANAATAAERCVNLIKGLNGFVCNVLIKGTNVGALWTGGSAVAGQTYQVNELGQEGFLSAGGRLSAINKPKNALWKAPSSGTVIPAHVWSELNVPTGGVSTGVRPMGVSGGGNGLQRIVRAIQLSMSQSGASDQAMHEMASVQARQALEIGKLSRAVNKLADKDHTVNVAVRNTGSTAYLQAMNRRM